jgi:hypothetical protein
MIGSWRTSGSVATASSSTLPSKGTFKVLSRAWSILDYTGLATLYLTFEGRGELLDGGGEKRRSG